MGVTLGAAMLVILVIVFVGVPLMLVSFYVGGRVVGAQRHREGYLEGRFDGYDEGWAAKTQRVTELHDDHVKNLRRKKPRFKLIRGGRS